VSTRPDRSWIATVDGKFSLGPVSLYYQVPFGEMHAQMVFSNALVPKDTFTVLDRYAILEYKDRFAKDRFGLTAKGYYTQFVRDFSIQLFPASVLLPGEPNDPNDPTKGWKRSTGGFQFSFAGQLVQRTGLTLDADLNLPASI